MVKIGTHNGTFHCDEVLACVLLRQLPQYKDSEIVRSRDPVVLDKCDIVVDVGSVFDPSLNRFDHHQRNFLETFKTLRPDKPWDIKLSSAGLVYVYYGKEVLSHIASTNNSYIDIDKLYDKIYENFVMEIDAIDNGVPVCEGEPRYAISSSLSSRVGNLNPWWNSVELNEQEQFKKAMAMVEQEFLDRVSFYMNCWWPARQMVKEAIESRFNVHETGSIIKFNQGGCPWKSHFFDIEKEMFESSENGDVIDANPHKILFVLYADNDNWRIQCIPVSEKRGFENRLGLYEPWRGLRDNELSMLTEIPDCIFVHTSGFIGGNKTYEGALKMAVDTLKYSNNA